MTLSEELQWRGFVNQTTYKDISILDGNSIAFYWGVDPSSDSMQIGNLAAAMMAKHFIAHGHKATLLVGGATGMIGDPDGKASERELQTLDQIELNKKGITNQYTQVFEGQDFKVVDNYDWFKDINYLDFLREIGKNVPMRQMLGRDFVQSRLSEDGNGISYAEFSYSLIQGYDFLHLYRNNSISLQLCGADQWGNSVAGVDLIRRIEGGEAHVWSTPLVVNKATGKKFGKTEDGAIWLDEKKTSVYKFYQFWLNVDDEGVSDYLKIYTMLDKQTIDALMNNHIQEKSARIAQKRLAHEVTKLIHGEQRAKSVQNISEVLFGDKDYSHLTPSDFTELSSELKKVNANHGADLLEIIVNLNLANSKGEARRFVNSGAIYINDIQINSEKITLEEKDFINSYCIIRRGKNTNALVQKT